MSLDVTGKVKWPPAWNPFEVFLLSLSLVASVGLLEGNSGSTVLDQRLSPLAVTMWGAALAIGSLLALLGIWCYRHPRHLLQGLYLERAGLVLVGTAAAVYSFVVLYSASDISGVRWSVCVQIAYAGACFFRAWQDNRAITLTRRIYRTMQTTSRGQGRDD